ncbi:dienelactone hydrolase family protein [Caulobacter sp. NIBR2454]|uniref:dienelactone hydrolase family protein n=1 Tax=Caulobacter sp. NIBR2454 TaxID=3015996 RepID=UPI0022B6529F|nr:dienelactone hydrolase family protein [Caulobacter sp. NIBR2454]
MGQVVTLTNLADGHAFEAFHVAPTDARRGGLVILHAIWGVTPHLRDLAASYADQGYEVLVPSLLDRFERGFPEVDIDPAARQRKMDFGVRTDWNATLGDIQAAIDWLKAPVFVMGFCWGGTAAWMAASRCTGIAAVSAFYGHQIAEHLDETPRVPLILHLGKRDELIPPAISDAIIAAFPDLPVYFYDAGHAFVAPAEYVDDAAKLARLRSLQLFHRAAGAKGEV